MAPEQLAAKEVTRATDVYAMGVVLWEILTGKRLFRGDDEKAVYAQALAGAEEPPSRHAPEVPAALDALVMKALAAEPGDRFASAEAMAEALFALVLPAFPTQVGRWVEEVASERLAQRGAVLAGIESRSDLLAATPFSGAPGQGEGTLPPEPVGGETLVDDPRGLGTEPSSVSVETSRPSLANVARGRGVRVGALAAVVVVAGGLAALVWRGGSAPTRLSIGASAPPVATTDPSSVSSVSEPVPSTSAAPPAPPLENATAVPVGTGRPASPVMKPRLPRPAGSIRFTQPD